MIWKLHSSFARGATLSARLGGEHPEGMGPLYRGSCLCGSVQYEVLLDGQSEPGVRSVWEQTVRPDHFKLLSGEDTLSGHQFAADQTQHFFCERCGLRCFSHHPASAKGGFYSVDLKSLELAHRSPRIPALC